ncbi:MAG: sel1 repeat family protein [Deltaproteobacteria bacterium]|nr:MAG: sel1 repeat family protein [Deltaproteobacteria bacterium]
MWWLALLIACEPGPPPIGPARGTAAASCRDTYDAYAPADPTDPIAKAQHYMRYDFERCQKGCDVTKDPWSCFATAEVYATGKGLTYDGPVDFAAAATYAEKGCALREATECPRAVEYTCQHDVEACASRCKAGEIGVCVAMAEPFDDYGGSRFDKDRSLPWLELACAGGVTEACTRRRLITCATDPLTCQEQCDEGEAAWCWEMGRQMQAGIGEMPKNPEKAALYAKKACEIEPTVDEGCKKVLLDALLEP